MSLITLLRRNNVQRALNWRNFSTTKEFARGVSAAASSVQQKELGAEIDSYSDLPGVLEKMNSTLERKNLTDPLDVLRWTMRQFDGKVAMSTSFGVQASVLLHLATQVKPEIPVVWVDTGYLPKETYQYAEELRETLNLNLIVKTNEEWSPARMEAIYGKLWEKDDAKSHQIYGKMRKVDPLQKGLDSIEESPLALLSGLRAAQTKARAGMQTVGFQNGRFKVLPMLKMTDDDVEKYIDMNDLPRHPLQSKGYVTVGDWHSSRPVEEGEDARNTRFGGKFQECGLHADESEEVESSEAVKEVSEGEKAYEATHVAALKETDINPETGYAVILVKKLMEDGALCRKCADVGEKLVKDNVEKWIGSTLYADMRETVSEGKTLAKYFEVATAPFFLVRKSSEENWKPVKSYLQLRKMLEKASKQKKN
eukprot:snap_masked-scaffold_24-processed-gene-1.19-mRNA-1 protein AED:0.04 eAED:0.06 QI:0/-1/0/1/-1/1/1/0/423